VKLKAYLGPERDNFILAIKNSSGEFPWTIIHIENDDTPYYMGMFLSEKNVETWHPMGFVWQ